MNLPSFQASVTHFVQTNNLEVSAQARLLDLISEVGELAKEALKATHYGRKSFQPSAAWAGELGDVFFSLICVANSTDINLEEALNEVLKKYERRLAHKGSASSQ